MRVQVIGCGYVGLPLARALAPHHSVRCVDTDRGKRYDAHALHLEAGLFPMSADAHLVCVPTPLTDGVPDASLVFNAVDALVPVLRPGDLVVIESTGYPGMARDAAERLPEGTLVASSPERVNPGGDHALTEIPKLIGGLTLEATDRAESVYAPVCPIVRCASPEIAEAAKLLENTFRAVNMALVHEFDDAMQALGIDTHQVIDAAATKPFGFMEFRPGAGVGGHCLPVDPYFLTSVAEDANVGMPLVHRALRVNRARPRRLARRVLEHVEAGAKVGVLGVTYKPNVPDVRESPAWSFMSTLEREGCETRWHDPLVTGSTPLCELEAWADVLVVHTPHTGMSVPVDAVWLTGEPGKVIA